VTRCSQVGCAMWPCPQVCFRITALKNQSTSRIHLVSGEYDWWRALRDKAAVRRCPFCTAVYLARVPALCAAASR
jgi:hypothetical protein